MVRHSYNQKLAYARRAGSAFSVARETLNAIKKYRSGKRKKYSQKGPAKKRVKGKGSSQSKYQSMLTIQSPSAGLSTSFTPLVYKKMKASGLNRTKSDMRASHYTGSIISNFGRQAFTTIGPNAGGKAMTQLGLIDAYNDSVSTTVGFEVDNQFTNNPLPGNPVTQRRMWVDSYESQSIISNQSPGTAVLYIYDIVCRKTGCQDPLTAWQNGMLNQGGTHGTGSLVRDHWTALPEETVYFKRCWKIVRKRRIEMASGRAHQHTFRFRYNGWVNLAGTYDETSGSVQQNIAGVTCTQLMISHGVACDSEALPGSASEITIDRIKLVVAASSKIKTRYLEVKPKNTLYASGALETSPTAAMIQAEDSAGTVMNNVANAVVAGAING